MTKMYKLHVKKKWQDIFPFKANDWVVSNKEMTEKTRYTIPGLTPGCKILVRVKAVNAAGESAPRTLQHSILVKEVIGKLWKKSFATCFICFIKTIRNPLK